MKNQISKLFAIALLLALAPLFISTTYAWSDDDDNNHHHHPSSPPPLEGVNKYQYKVGDRGPGGGFIFFVDYFGQYPHFTYLEAAPTDIAAVAWCNRATTSIPAVNGWSPKGVGKGRANTTAMLGVCTSGAAKAADLYLTSTKSDWFLPSIGEVKLMYDNLIEAGVGRFAVSGYWSSTEDDSFFAWSMYFNSGGQLNVTKEFPLLVRAIRAF